MEGDCYHKKFLVIQTASIGDVILATSVAEKLHQTYPEACIDFMIKKGCEGLVDQHPFFHKIYVWNKKHHKYTGLLRILKEVRKERYDAIIDLHRFASSGIIAAFGKAQRSYGFQQNPLSFLFSTRVPHIIGGTQGLHEIARNQQLIENLCPGTPANPRLYPAKEVFESIQPYQTGPYITIAPMSLWFTKQFPSEKWLEFISTLSPSLTVYLTGGANDQAELDALALSSGRKNVINLASKMSLLQSAALMKGALMNYTNDSAPLHLGSAVNAPLTAIFCSTVPAFGFGPLSDGATIIETDEELACRPCGIHGRTSCPEKHFACALGISIKKLTERIVYE